MRRRCLVALRRRNACRAIDDLVELATVKLDTPAIWTVIYFDVLAFRHYESRCLAIGTVHGFYSFRFAYQALPENDTRQSAILIRPS